jgi:uncharacterized protein
MIYFAKDNPSSRDYFLSRPELAATVKDILTNDEFVYGVGHLRTHRYETRQKHLLNVAYYALWLARLLRADRRAVMRAALLHDFYPYIRPDSMSFNEHNRSHPKKAVAHARKFFVVEPLVTDIVLDSHNWSLLRIVKFWRPHWREHIAVSLSDLFCSGMENFYHGVAEPTKRRAKNGARKTKNGVKKAAVKAKSTAVKAGSASKAKVSNARANSKIRKATRQAKKNK